MDDARASIEIGSRRTEVVARTVGGGEPELLWERAVEIYPPYSEYQRHAERTLPVIVLEPAPPAAGPQNLAD
jgi:F420H(2)-dependent quinone reductase